MCWTIVSTYSCCPTRAEKTPQSFSQHVFPRIMHQKQWRLQKTKLCLLHAKFPSFILKTHRAEFFFRIRVFMFLAQKIQTDNATQPDVFCAQPKPFKAFKKLAPWTESNSVTRQYTACSTSILQQAPQRLFTKMFLIKMWLFYSHSHKKGKILRINVLSQNDQ